MRNNSDLVVKIALLVSDFLMIVGSFVAAYVIRVRWDERALRDPVEAETYLYIFLALIPIWLIIYASLNLYKQKVYQSRVEEASRLFFGSAIGIMVIVFADFLTDEPIYPARLVPIYGFIIAYLSVLLSRNIIHFVRAKLYSRGIGIKRTLIVSSNGSQIVQQLVKYQPTGHKIVGIVGVREHKLYKQKRITVYKSLSSALAQVTQRRIDTIIQTELNDDHAQSKQVLEAVQKNHLEYMIYPSFESGITVQSQLELLDGQPVLKIKQTPLDGWWRIAKRMIDIFGASLGIIVLSPLLLFIALLVKLTDPGPAIFKHQRVTRFGEKFYVYKFRSMYQKYSSVGSHSIQERIQQFKEMGREDLIDEFRKYNKVKEDPRITKLGNFLRATSLDELPQLFNILRGDLSIVGPRPVSPDELKMYEGPYESLFLSIRPGLSGLWQVSGRNDLSNEERVQLDVYYIQNWSLILDIKIILKTVAVVIRRVGSR